MDREEAKKWALSVAAMSAMLLTAKATGDHFQYLSNYANYAGACSSHMIIGLWNSCCAAWYAFEAMTCYNIIIPGDSQDLPTFTDGFEYDVGLDVWSTYENPSDPNAHPYYKLFGGYTFWINSDPIDPNNAFSIWFNEYKFYGTAWTEDQKRTVAQHELGHSIGLAHCDGIGTRTMNADGTIHEYGTLQGCEFDDYETLWGDAHY